MFKSILIQIIINLVIIKVVESDIEMEPEFIKWLFQKDVSLREIKEYKCLQVDQENGLNIDMDCIHLWYPDYTEFKRRLADDNIASEVKGIPSEMKVIPSDYEPAVADDSDIDDDDNDDEDNDQDYEQ